MAEHTSDTSADVVIAGAGVMGSAVAYYLRKLGFTGSIVIIEADTSFANCSTARSAGGIRQQVSTPENIALSQATLQLIRSLKDEFGTDAEVGFREQGYLILASSDGEPVLAANVATQRRQGAATELLYAAALSERFPWLVTDGVAAGAFGPTGEGWLDPVSLMTLYRKAAVDAGATLLRDRVTSVHRSGARIAGVGLAGGRRIACGTFVNAAGFAAGEVSGLAGIVLPVEPRKRFVYVLDCREASEALHKAPLTVDPSGIWFRPEGRLFIAGLSPGEAEEPTPGDLDAIDHAFFEEQVWPGLAARVPALEAIKVVNAWAGHYDYNTLDQNAVIGPHPDVANFYFCNGFSGHGLQQSAGAGRGVAEHIIYGGYRAIDLTRLGYGRVARGEPLFELNVI